MNNLLEELIGNFTSQELRDFKYFISRRNNHVHERKDLLTIEHIRRQNVHHNTLSNAEHQVQKRLRKQLEQFVQLENLRFDITSVSFNFIEVATYLFRKKMPGHAWQYLLKAELNSLESEDYILLDFIYYIQIAYASNIYGRVLPASSFKKLIEKRNANLLLSMLDANANAAYAEIRYQIKELNSISQKNDIQGIINKTLNQYHLSDKIYTHPRIYGKIVNIVCSGLAEIEEYREMADYAVSAFQIVKQYNMLETMHPDYLMELLLAICQSHLRVKNYTRCYQFLSIYRLRTEVFRHRYDKYSYHKFMQGLIDIKFNCCKGDLNEAEDILFSLLHDHEKDSELINDFHLVYMQLMAIYFSQGSIEPCIRLYNNLMREKTNGKSKNISPDLDQKMLLEIYSVIFYYEIKDLDYAHELLKKVKRSYRSLLKSDDNKRYHFFIKMLEDLIKDPFCSARDKFKEECQQFVAIKKYVPDNKEYISLNAWLLSKCTGQHYYELFLEQSRP